MKVATSSTARGSLWSTALLVGAALSAVLLQGQTNGNPGGANIASVSPISTKAYQTIVIRGLHLGVNPPFDGCPDHMRVTDVTTNWSVPAVGPFGGCQAGIFVSSWSDNEIVIEGFPSFQKGQDAFKIGDVIKIEISNAQQGGTAAWFSVRVGDGSHIAAPTAPPPNPTPSPRQESAVLYDLSGKWLAYYPGGPLEVSIKQAGRKLTATLLTGNEFVPAGQVTFYGSQEANPFEAQQICAHPHFTGPFWIAVKITIIDGDHFTEDGTGCGGFPVVWKRQRTAPATVSPKPIAATTVAAASAPAPLVANAKVVKAIVQKQATSLELPAGKMYLYGMETGGGFPSSPFAEGQYAKVENADGKLSAALAYGTNNRNSYSTQTAYHTIGGVSVGGSWKHFVAFYGSNRKREAHDASVSFQTSEDSLVVVFGLAGDQKVVGFDGLPGLEVDASGGGELIAHAYVKPGTFNVVEHSAVAAAGQDPAHMTDLVGVFVFGGEELSNPPAVASESSPVDRGRGSDAKRSVRDVDFQNFDYESSCLEENAPAKVIHISNGQANNQDGQFWADKPVYGDFKGDGHELAAVALGCHPADMSPNVNFSEVFVFEWSEDDPKVLAKLPPSFWKEARVTGLKVSNQQLEVDFLEMGDKGSNACPEWVVTSKLHWNGSRFVSASESRRKNSCAP
jgi:hypothetical protein